AGAIAQRFSSASWAMSLPCELATLMSGTPCSQAAQPAASRKSGFASGAATGRSKADIALGAQAPPQRVGERGRRGGAARGPRSRGLRPDRLREMAVVGEARDHVPVQVLRHVAQAREVHLVGTQQLAQRGLGREHRVHEARALVLLEIGHFLDVALQDHAAESRIVRVSHADDAAEAVPPEDLAAVRSAQLAARGVPGGGRVDFASGHAPSIADWTGTGRVMTRPGARPRRLPETPRGSSRRSCRTGWGATAGSP